MSKPLTLSLIIPAYNEEKHLRRCLDAIAKQTVMPDEVIVVNNNSKDNTAKVAQEYSFVIVINESKQGIVHARNAGFNAAKMDLIGRIDADTVLEPNWVATAKDTCARKPEVAAVTGDCLFYDFPFRRVFQLFHHFGYYTMQRIIAGTEILWGSNMVLRRDAWQEVAKDGVFHNEVHEDIELSLQLHDRGLTIIRDKGLQAHVSLRRGDIGPKSIVKYLLPWPRTYWVNYRYVSTMLIWCLLGSFLLVILPLSVLRALFLGPRHFWKLLTDLV